MDAPGDRAILPDQRDRPSGAAAGGACCDERNRHGGARNRRGRSQELAPCDRHPVANDIPSRPQAQVTEPRPISVARRLAVSRYPTAHTDPSGAAAAPVNTSEPGTPGPSTMDHPAPSKRWTKARFMPLLAPGLDPTAHASSAETAAIP